MKTIRNGLPLIESLKRMSARRMLLLSLLAFALLCLYRVYDLWVTGFFVSDEYGYIQNSIEGSVFNNAAFGYRVFVAILDVTLFRVLGIRDVDSFILFFPFYLFLWGGSALCLTYMILRTLGTEERIIKFTLFSSFFLVSFVLFSLGFLTEAVGLSLAMLGILFLLKFAKQDPGGPSYLAYPLLGALALGAARYTREPYALFLLGGVLVVAFITFNQVRSADKSFKRRVAALTLIAVVLYSGPSLYLLNNPVPLFAQTGSSIESFGNTIVHPVITVNTTSTVSSTRTVTFTTTTVATSEVLITETHVHNGTTVTTITTTSTVVTRNQTITTTVEATQVVPITVLILNNQIANTFLIFFAGIVLGWGPILFIVGLIGFMLLTRRVLGRKDSISVVVLLLVMLALGSYFFVSFIFSPDPYYLNLGQATTIIRFSDTTLPAYFLVAPLAFSAIDKRKHMLATVGVILIVFLAIGVPTYESYAASSLNLDNNPFSLSYRSPGVQIRDYILANPPNRTYYIMGYPELIWFWTPGKTFLNSVSFMSPLNQSQFIQRHWSTFYVYCNSMGCLNRQFPYLFNATQSSAQGAGGSPLQQFVITSRHVIFDNQQGVFMQLTASWTS